jgi:hypothetical protein
MSACSYCGQQQPAEKPCSVCKEAAQKVAVTVVAKSPELTEPMIGPIHLRPGVEYLTEEQAFEKYGLSVPPAPPVTILQVGGEQPLELTGEAKRLESMRQAKRAEREWVEREAAAIMRGDYGPTNGITPEMAVDAATELYSERADTRIMPPGSQQAELDALADRNGPIKQCPLCGRDGHVEDSQCKRFATTIRELNNGIEAQLLGAARNSIRYLKFIHAEESESLRPIQMMRACSVRVVAGDDATRAWCKSHQSESIVLMCQCSQFINANTPFQEAAGYIGKLFAQMFPGEEFLFEVEPS